MNQRAALRSRSARACLSAWQGTGPVEGMADEGEGEIPARLGAPREHLVEGAAAEQLGIGVRRAQRVDDAARGDLGVAEPEEAVAARDDLLGAQVGPAPGGRDERQRGRVVLRPDGGGQRRRHVAVFGRRGIGEPAGQAFEEAVKRPVADGGADSTGGPGRQQAAAAGEPEDAAEQARRVVRIGAHDDVRDTPGIVAHGRARSS